MKGEVFFAAVAVHLVPHYLKHLRVASYWSDREEFQPLHRQVNGNNPTDKGAVFGSRNECF